jgi:hypothetical protein
MVCASDLNEGEGSFLSKFFLERSVEMEIREVPVTNNAADFMLKGVDVVVVVPHGGGP